MTELGILVDGDARSTVVNALDRNLFVEAGAGTGKTTVLVGRVVQLIATGRVDEPSGLVAITFTEAAAAQLRDRIRTSLESAASDPSMAPEQQERCAKVARGIDDAVITTLHGFAQRILTEHPLAAGLPPAFEVDEGIPAQLAFRARWSVFIDELLADPDLEADLVLGVALGLPLERLQDVARIFHDRWDRLVGAALVDPGPVERPGIDGVRDPLRRALVLLGHRAGSGDGLANLLEGSVAPNLDILDVAAATDDPVEALRALDGIWLRKPGTSGRKEVWGDDKAIVIDLVNAAIEARTEVLDGLRRAVLERVLPHLARFTLDWAEERRAAGRLHFHDLLVLARDVLWRDASVRTQLAKRYAVLLVDEFQDTDPLQVEIVFALAAADAHTLPARWDDIELAEGKVLVVGDAKQSIYGFRGADITLWNRTRARFGADVVHLTQNFRSVAHILEWVNTVFERLMQEGESQPAYEDLAAHRVNLDELPAVVSLGGPTDAKAAEVRLAEADDVAAVIQTLKAIGRPVDDDAPGAEPGVTRPVRYADIAILLPTRAPLGPIERALDDADIPYRVESRSLVWATDAVREVLAVLTAIEDPADEVAVVAALRSPAFACRDDELVAYRRAGGRWDHTRTPPDDLDPDHPVVAALAALRHWHDQRWWAPVNELVEMVVRERRLVEFTLAQRRPRDHWRRLRFVIDQARAFVEAGGATLADFLAWAEVQTDESAAVVETVVPEPDDDAVRILTVHGSKGLEFPVVVLAGLSTGAPPGGPAVLWAGEQPEVSFGVMYRPDSRFTTGGFAELKVDHKQAEVEESVRLLYVAATRARDQLVVSLHHKALRPGSKPNTHAEALYLHVGQAVPTWNAAFPPYEPTLLDGLPPLGPPASDAATRAAWVAERRAVLDRARRPWAVAPTGLASLQAAGDEFVAFDDDAGDDDAAMPDPAASAGDDAEPAVPAYRRGGTTVGRAVHTVLETVDLAGTEPVPVDDVEQLAALAAAAEGLDADAADTIARLAQSALDSAALIEARASGRFWRELPVVAVVGERLIEGFIDLLYETAAGELVVVDWKTDRARSDGEVDAALERYRLQAAGYALAVEAVTSRPVRRCRFVFCRPDGPAIERDVADLDAARATGMSLLTR